MIKTIAHKGLKRFYDQDERSKLPPDMVERIGLILEALDILKNPLIFLRTHIGQIRFPDHEDSKGIRS